MAERDQQANSPFSGGSYPFTPPGGMKQSQGEESPGGQPMPPASPLRDQPDYPMQPPPPPTAAGFPSRSEGAGEGQSRGMPPPPSWQNRAGVTGEGAADSPRQTGAPSGFDSAGEEKEIFITMGGPQPPYSVEDDDGGSVKLTLIILGSVLGLVGLVMIAGVAMMASAASSVAKGGSSLFGGANSPGGANSGAATWVDMQAHQLTVMRLQFLSGPHNRYFNATDEWATDIGDLLAFGASKDQLFDGWDVRMRTDGNRIVSAGMDNKMDTGDDVWIDVESMSVGGEMPDVDTNQKMNLNDVTRAMDRAQRAQIEAQRLQNERMRRMMEYEQGVEPGYYEEEY